MNFILEMFSYDFMIRAFIVSIALSIVIPCIAIVVVFKRLSMTGDALSHSSLAGVAAGLLFSFNPIIGSTLACIIAAISIEIIRKKFRNYADLAIALVMSTSVAVAGILTGFMKTSTNLHSFLFGSIVAISDEEMYIILAISVVVLTVFVLMYKELFYTTFDEEAARLAGIKVSLVNIIFTFLTAFTISIAARTVGTLIVSSFIVVPIACAMQISKSYRSTLISAICFAIIFSIVGLVLAYVYPLVPGATMVLIGIATLIILTIVKYAARRIGRG